MGIMWGSVMESVTWCHDPVTICSSVPLCSHILSSPALCIALCLFSVPVHFSLTMFFPPTPQTYRLQAVHQMSSDFSSFPRLHTCPHSVLPIPSSAPHYLYRPFSFVLCQVIEVALCDTCFPSWSHLILDFICSCGLNLFACLSPVHVLCHFELFCTSSCCYV